MQYQMNKFRTKSSFILFAECMKPSLRSESFHPGRQVRVSSEHEDFGDRQRVVADEDPSKLNLSRSAIRDTAPFQGLA